MFFCVKMSPKMIKHDFMELRIHNNLVVFGLVVLDVLIDEELVVLPYHF